MNDSKPQTTADFPRNLKNDAEWLRTIAKMADTIPPHGDDLSGPLVNQWLWPETKANLLDIAREIEGLAKENERLSNRIRGALRFVNEYGDYRAQLDKICLEFEDILHGPKGKSE